MEITESKHDGVVVLGLKGRLDASNAGTLEARVLALIGGGDTRFVVDCAGLDYISSAGLRVLLVAAKRLSAAGGKIVLAALKDPIKEVLDIAGFSAIFTISRSPDEAIAGMK